jgi:hypothetical protein
MTRVTVQSGICGFSVLVTVEKDRERNLRIQLDTECEMVKKMAEDISFLEFRAPFATILHNPVYRSASKNLRHAACPVPSGILKAIEVELGVCLPRPVSITFEKKEEKG